MSSTVTQDAVCSPARSTSWFSSRKPSFPIDQQPHHLPLADADPDRPQLRHQPLHRHLTLVVLHQHIALQLWSEVAADARRQRRHQRLARRRQPALAPVAHRPCSLSIGSEI